MANRYRFKVGDKVRIHATKTSSPEVKENHGKIVTIKALCKFTWAYYLEELPHLWHDACFKEV